MAKCFVKGFIESLGTFFGVGAISDGPLPIVFILEGGVAYNRVHREVLKCSGFVVAVVDEDVGGAGAFLWMWLGVDDKPGSCGASRHR